MDSDCSDDSGYNSGSYSNSGSNNSYGSENEDESGGSNQEEIPIDDEEVEEDSNQLAKDKEWLDSFIHDKLKKQITDVESEVNIIRNKKIRGASKK